VEIYKYVYPSNWPLTGLQLLLLGKIFWYLADTPQTIQYLQEASTILNITHGHSNNYVISQLNDMLKGAMMEYHQQQQLQ